MQSHQPSPAILAMLHSNLSRVNSQHQRLTALLRQSQTLQKMAQHAQSVQSLSSHLDQLRMRVESSLEQSIEERQAKALKVSNEMQYAHSNINGRIKQLRNRIATFEMGQREREEKHKSRVKKELTKTTKDLLSNVKHQKQEYLTIIDKTHKQHQEAVQSVLIPRISKQIKAHFEYQQQQCKAGTGHLLNLLEYHLHKQHHLDWRQCGDELAEVGQAQMGASVEGAERMLRGVVAEISWLRRNKRKNESTTTSNSRGERSSVGENSLCMLEQIEIVIQEVSMMKEGLVRLKAMSCHKQQEKPGNDSKILNKCAQLATKASEYRAILDSLTH